MPNFGRLACLALWSVSLWGQGETTSAIVGTVTDERARRLPAPR
ncbi:MAG: hypothetical protein ACLPY2_11955 [Bryobacteraceae bacterium]